MANPVRILFASSEVEPFAAYGAMAEAIRKLPERLQDLGGFESRIMMPRYGLISERRNRLHEVIRLSGCKIKMGEESEALKVKVASIPGIRLQVYFMDSAHLFKRKGIYQSTKMGVFEDNLARSVFFARSVLMTTKNLGWSPDIIHAHGWLASMIPVIAHTDYGSDSLFGQSRSVYSPDGFTSGETFSPENLEAWNLNADLAGATLTSIGCKASDAVVYGSDMEPPCEPSTQLPDTEEAITEVMADLYGKVLASGSVAA